MKRTLVAACVGVMMMVCLAAKPVAKEQDKLPYPVPKLGMSLADAKKLLGTITQTSETATSSHYVFLWVNPKDKDDSCRYDADFEKDGMQQWTRMGQGRRYSPAKLKVKPLDIKMAVGMDLSDAFKAASCDGTLTSEARLAKGTLFTGYVWRYTDPETVGASSPRTSDLHIDVRDGKIVGIRR